MKTKEVASEKSLRRLWSQIELLRKKLSKPSAIERRGTKDT